MGELRNGPWGKITGKVGGLVGTTRNGKNIVKNAPTRTAEPSAKQLEQQLKFKMAIDFFRPLKDLVQVTFDNGGNASGMNNATGRFLENAISGTSPNIIIDYSKVNVSRGHLPPAADTAVTIDGTMLTFTWEDNSALGSANETDLAVVVVYCPAKNQAIFKMDLATRNAGTGSISASLFKGQEVHTYLAFITADKKKASDSVYTGKLMVNA
jgi:hypothetical protein